MINRLILVRHGESTGNQGDVISGWTSVPLTEKGKQQAQATGRALSRILTGCSCRIYSSDLERAAETASIIERELSINPVLTPGLRDINMGIGTGKPVSEAKSLQLPAHDPLIDWVPYPGAESWRMMDNRISSFLELVTSDDVDTIILISHGNPIVSIVHWWLGIRDDASISRIMVQADISSISIFTIDSWGSRVISLVNSTSHLD